MHLGDVVQNLTLAVGSLSLENIGLVIASIVAVVGVLNWRFEAAAKRKHEVIEEGLEFILLFRDQLKGIRLPALMTTEAEERSEERSRFLSLKDLHSTEFIQRLEGEHDRERHVREIGFAVRKRTYKKREFFTKLRSLQARFRILFGADAEAPFLVLFEALNKVHIAGSVLESITVLDSDAKVSEDRFTSNLQDLNRLRAQAAQISDNDKIDKLLEEVNEILLTRCVRSSRWNLLKIKFPPGTVKRMQEIQKEIKSW